MPSQQVEQQHQWQLQHFSWEIYRTFQWELLLEVVCPLSRLIYSLFLYAVRVVSSSLRAIQGFYKVCIEQYPEVHFDQCQGAYDQKSSIVYGKGIPLWLPNHGSK